METHSSNSTKKPHGFDQYQYEDKPRFDQLLGTLLFVPTQREIIKFQTDFSGVVEFINNPTGIFLRDEREIADFFSSAFKKLERTNDIHDLAYDTIHSFLKEKKSQLSIYEGMPEVLGEWGIKSTEESTHDFRTKHLQDLHGFGWVEEEEEDYKYTGGNVGPAFGQSSHTVHLPKNDGTYFANLVHSDYINHPNLMSDLRKIQGLEYSMLALDIYNHPDDLDSTPSDRLLVMFRNVFENLSPGHGLQGVFRQFFVDRLQTIASKVESHELQELQRLAKQQASHQYSHFEAESSFVRHEKAESFVALQERFSSYASFGEDLALIESLENFSFSKALYDNFETYCDQQYKQLIFSTFEEVLTDLRRTNGLQGAYRQFFEDRLTTLHKEELIEVEEYFQLYGLIMPQDEMTKFKLKPDGSSTPPPYFLIAWGVVALAASIPYIWIPAFKGARSLVNRVFYNQQPIPVPKGPKV